MFGFCAIIKAMTELHQVLQTDPLVLAYVGDAYFSLKVREFFVKSTGFGAGALHNRTKRYVSAVAQARIWDNLIPELSELELDLGRRARNRHNSTAAKNSTLQEYKKATALECVLGFLYLMDNQSRLQELMDRILGGDGQDGIDTER